MQTLSKSEFEALKEGYRRMREEMRSHYNPMGLMTVAPRGDSQTVETYETLER